MPLRDYEAVWTFSNADEPGVRLDLEIFDGRRGDTVRLRRTSMRGLLRRTVLAIQIEAYQAGDDEAAPVIIVDTSTLKTAAALAAHLRLRGWNLEGTQLNVQATKILAPIALVRAPFAEEDFRYVGEQLPFELRASLIEHRASMAQRQAVGTMAA